MSDSNILIVDRIEAGFAVCECEGGTFTLIALSDLPRNIREGDCLRQGVDGYIIDSEQTAKRRAHNKSLFDQLKKPR